MIEEAAMLKADDDALAVAASSMLRSEDVHVGQCLVKPCLFQVLPSSQPVGGPTTVVLSATASPAGWGFFLVFFMVFFGIFYGFPFGRRASQSVSEAASQSVG